MPVITISAETFARLQKHAVPLIDTLESVLQRALDALDAGSNTPQAGGGTKSFNPEAPPSLAFTTVRSITLEGKRLPPAQTYWNTLLYAVVREAAKQLSPSELDAALPLNTFIGVKEDNGYRYIPEAGISVQGQSADAAWKATYILATLCGLSVNVAFVWQHNLKAAYPGESGTMSIKPAAV